MHTRLYKRQKCASIWTVDRITGLIAVLVLVTQHPSCYEQTKIDEDDEEQNGMPYEPSPDGGVDIFIHKLPFDERNFHNRGTDPIPPSTSEDTEGIDCASYTDSPPIIDGDLSESNWNLKTPIHRVLYGKTDNTVSFDVMWDETYLYVAVLVEDFDVYTDSYTRYDDDSVELFVDAMYTKRNPDNRNAWSFVHDKFSNVYVVEVDDTNVFVKMRDWSSAVVTATARTSTGYTVEFAVPWLDDLNVQPVAESYISFDIGVNDDDDGGTRDAHLMWNGDDYNWFYIDGFGTLVLSGET